MKRLRLPIMLLAAVAVLPAAFAAVTPAPAAAQEEGGSDLPADRQPAVVISEDTGAQQDEAWTFRFLVPTVLALSALVVVGVALLYVVRVRGRYRVAR